MDLEATAANRAPSGDSPAASAPDWNQITEEIRCPLCDYNLRGIAEPRCPECGYRTTWPQLLDPSARIHPYIFEHHPDKKFRSFIRTMLGGLRPRKFWTSLHPAQPSRPRNLAIYAVACMVPVIVAAAIYFACILTQFGLFNQQQRAWEQNYVNSPPMKELRASVINQYGSVNAYLDSTYPVTPMPLIRQYGHYLLQGGYWAPFLVIMLWAPLTLLVLCIFRWSMRRARVRTSHLARCTVYSGDVTWWVPFLMLLANAVLLFLYRPSVRRTQLLGFEFIGMLTVSLFCLAIFIYRLCIAYRRYLRFPHAIATVLASQLIVFLAMVNLLLVAKLK